MSSGAIVGTARILLGIDDSTVSTGMHRAEESVQSGVQGMRSHLSELEASQLKVKIAQENYTSAVAKSGPESRRAESALLRLTDAQKGLAHASLEAVDAQKKQSSGLTLLSGHAKNAEHDLNGATRGALAGSEAFKGLGRQVAFASASFLGGAGLISVLKSSIDLAGQEQLQLQRSSTLFGSHATEVQKWAGSVTSSLGLAKDDALKFTNNTGTMLRNLGLAPEKAAAMSIQLTKLGVNLAAFKGVPVEQTMQSLTRGLLGSSRGLKEYGISLDSTSLKAEAMRLGLVKSTVDMGTVKIDQEKIAIAQAKLAQAQKDYGRGSTQVQQATDTLAAAHKRLDKAMAGVKTALTPTQKALASYGLEMHDTALEHDYFAKHTNTLGEREKILQAQLKEVRGEIGTALLPTVVKYLTELSKWIDKLEKSGQLQKDVNIVVHDAVGFATDLGNAIREGWKIFETAAGWVGGIKDALELMIAAMAINKVRAFADAMVKALLNTETQAAKTKAKVIAANVEMGASGEAAAAGTATAWDIACANMAAAMKAVLISSVIGILVIGIGLAVLEIIKHWNTVKQWMVDFGDWIKGHAYALLALPGIGAVAFMAVEMIKHWNDVKAFVVNFASDLALLFTHPVEAIEKIFHQLEDAVKTVFRGILKTILSVIDIIPNKILGISTGVGGIKSALQSWVDDFGQAGTDAGNIFSSNLQSALAGIANAVNPALNDALHGRGGLGGGGVTPGVGVYDQKQIYQLLIGAGADPSVAANLSTISAHGEDPSGQIDILNNNPKTKDYSEGLFQENFYGSLGPSRVAQFAPQFGLPGTMPVDKFVAWLGQHPAAQAKIALSIYDGSGYGAWSTAAGLGIHDGGPAAPAPPGADTPGKLPPLPSVPALHVGHKAKKPKKPHLPLVPANLTQALDKAEIDHNAAKQLGALDAIRSWLTAAIPKEHDITKQTQMWNDLKNVQKQIDAASSKVAAIPAGLMINLETAKIAGNKSNEMNALNTILGWLAQEIKGEKDKKAKVKLLVEEAKYSAEATKLLPKVATAIPANLKAHLKVASAEADSYAAEIPVYKAIIAWLDKQLALAKSASAKLKLKGELDAERAQLTVAQMRAGAQSARNQAKLAKQAQTDALAAEKAKILALEAGGGAALTATTDVYGGDPAAVKNATDALQIAQAKLKAAQAKYPAGNIHVAEAQHAADLAQTALTNAQSNKGKVVSKTLTGKEVIVFDPKSQKYMVETTKPNVDAMKQELTHLLKIVLPKYDREIKAVEATLKRLGKHPKTNQGNLASLRAKLKRLKNGRAGFLAQATDLNRSIQDIAAALALAPEPDIVDTGDTSSDLAGTDSTDSSSSKAAADAADTAISQPTAVDQATHAENLAQAGLTALQLHDELTNGGTASQGYGTAESGYINSTLIPAMQATLATLQASLVAAQQANDGTLANQIGESIASKQNDILNAQLQALNDIKGNTAVEDQNIIGYLTGIANLVTSFGSNVLAAGMSGLLGATPPNVRSGGSGNPVTVNAYFPQAPADPHLFSTAVGFELQALIG